MGDVIQVQGINSKGYGSIPKLVMQDRRLTIYAKAIYSYFASYAGAGQTAFPKRDKILTDLGISKDYYYKSLALLKDCGYVNVTKDKDRAGRFARNIYTLLESLPCPSAPDTVGKDMAPCPSAPDTVEKDTKINKNQKEQYFSKINQSLKSKHSGNEDGADAMEGYREIIHENIQYAELCDELGGDRTNELVELMVETVCTTKAVVRVGGEQLPADLVRGRLLKLRREHIQYVADRLSQNTTRIRNIRGYLLTALYNAPATITHHYAAEVAHDWYARPPDCAP